MTLNTPFRVNPINVLSDVVRVEVIDQNGRSYINWKDDNNVEVELQDNGRTLKVFISNKKPH
jgi:hypothetical protein